MSNPGYKIVIADTQFLVVEALKSLLGNDERFSIAGIVNSQYELYKVLEQEPCQLLITDNALLDFDSPDDLQAIKRKYPKLSILILTNLLSKAEFAELSKIGIKNIIYKTADRDEVLSAIDAAFKGKKYYADEILDMMLEMGESKSVLEEPTQLTVSEIEIVRLIANGLTTKEIAARKNISFHTVNTHRKNIFRKMGVSNASELIILAIKSGWIDNIEYYI
jgi:DNA-binding NarL/FixJ family response regulator